MKCTYVHTQVAMQTKEKFIWPCGNCIIYSLIFESKKKKINKPHANLFKMSFSFRILRLLALVQSYIFYFIFFFDWIEIHTKYFLRNAIHFKTVPPFFLFFRVSVVFILASLSLIFSFFFISSLFRCANKKNILQTLYFFLFTVYNSFLVQID